MSFNLVDLVKDQLTGQIKGHVSKMLGNESGKADAALGAAVPGLLKGLAQSASTPSGADSLLKAVNNQDAGLLDNLGNMLGGDKASSVVDTGNKALGSLFGDKGVGALTGAVSGVSGISKGGAKSIMGMAAPMVMGVIKQKVMSGGLNASGLASMLKGQEENINKAMPAGLGDQLSSQGFLSSISGGASAAAGKATAAASSAGSAAKDAASNAKQSASNFGGSGDGNGGSPIWKKILPIALVLGLVWVAMNLFKGKSETETDAATTEVVEDTAANAAAEGEAAVEGAVAEGEAAVEGAVAEGEAAVEGAVAEGEAAVEEVVAEGEAAVEGAVAEGEAAVEEVAAEGEAAAEEVAAEEVAAEGEAATEEVVTEGEASETDAEASVAEVDRSSFSLGAISRKFGGFFGTTGAVLGSVTDADSATAALPKLEEISGGLDGVMSEFDAVPEVARGPLNKVVSSGVAKLTPLVDTVMNKEGVGDVLGGVVGPMMDKLKSVSQ